MKKVNNLIVLGTMIAIPIIAYKVTNKVLGKLVPRKVEIKKEKMDNIINFDEYKEADLLDYEYPRIERQYIRVK